MLEEEPQSPGINLTGRKYLLGCVACMRVKRLEGEVVVGDSEHLAEGDDIFLEVGDDGHAVLADVLFHLVFLLVGGVDAGVAGGFA